MIFSGHRKGGDDDLTGQEKRNKFKRKNSELKRPEQILKQRKLKAKKQAFQKGREKMHKSNKMKQKK